MEKFKSRLAVLENTILLLLEESLAMRFKKNSAA